MDKCMMTDDQVREFMRMMGDTSLDTGRSTIVRNADGSCHVETILGGGRKAEKAKGRGALVSLGQGDNRGL
jgi:hypothetical protein